MNKAVAKVKYRGKKIKVYADDYGQCYYFLYNGKSYSCGTFNPDYLGEIVDVIDDDLDKVFHVMPDREHRPSAKVYKRNGLWYMDYDSWDGLLLSYGDILPKDERPSQDDLIRMAHKWMDTIDNRGKEDGQGVV